MNMRRANTPVVAEVAKAGFDVVDVEDLRLQYARTLRTWSRRLEARKDEAIEAAGVERYRMWVVYLAGTAEAFERAGSPLRRSSP